MNFAVFNSQLIVYNFKTFSICQSTTTGRSTLPAKQSTTARRAFSAVCPSVWNSSPGYLRDPVVGRDTFRQLTFENVYLLRNSTYSALEVSFLAI